VFGNVVKLFIEFDIYIVNLPYLNNLSRTKNKYTVAVMIFPIRNKDFAIRRKRRNKIVKIHANPSISIRYQNTITAIVSFLQA